MTRLKNPPTRPWKARWQRQLQYGAMAQCGKRKLALIHACNEKTGEWTAFALETTATELEDILDSHSHQIIGTFNTQSAARLACESYAEVWAAKKRAAKRCACKPIATPRRKRRA